MDTTRIHDHDDTLDAHYSCLERLRPHGVPHGCMNGLVFIGHLVEDLETGEEVEVFESGPCRRCASNAGVSEAFEN